MFLFALFFLPPLGTIRAAEGMDMGKSVLYLAMSVDGYIADERGGVSWLAGDGSQPDSGPLYSLSPSAHCRSSASFRRPFSIRPSTILAPGALGRSRAAD